MQISGLAQGNFVTESFGNPKLLLKMRGLMLDAETIFSQGGGSPGPDHGYGFNGRFFVSFPKVWAMNPQDVTDIVSMKNTGSFHYSSIHGLAHKCGQIAGPASVRVQTPLVA